MFCFCGECGAKNTKGDSFCAECGSKLVTEEVATTSDHSFLNQQVPNQQPVKPMTKTTKMVIVIALALIAVIVALVVIFNNITNPKAVAKDYIKSLVNQDADKLYGYLEIAGDKTFVSKDVFKKQMKDVLEDTKIINYTITDVNYSDSKLKATVNYKYTLQNSSSEKTDSVVLSKQNDNKLLFFPNWKVSGLSFDVIQNYTIKVAKGSKLTFGGIKVNSKYLDKKESSSMYDVYNLPQVFSYETVIKAELPNGFEIEQEVTPSSYNSLYTVEMDEDNMTESSKEKLNSLAIAALNKIYGNIVENKSFADIKGSFVHGKLDLTNLESNYNELVTDLSDENNTLTSFNATKASIYDVELNSDGYLEVEFKVNYDYAIKYKSWDDKEETHSDSDYDYMTLKLAYDKGTYYVIGFDDLNTYFSRY